MNTKTAMQNLHTVWEADNMSLNLVTGKRGTAHISSADWRSLNRGIVGEGKFFLEDTSTNSKGDFSINASSGEITIPPRSFIWSGMHIRNDASFVVRYVPPTSTSNINLWLHYTKESDSGIENVEFVTTIDSSPYPVADVIEDITTNAYTSVISFVHNAESASAQNVTVNFKKIASLKEYEASIKKVLSKSETIDTLVGDVKKLDTAIKNETSARQQAVSAEEKARKQAINAEKSARETAITNAVNQEASARSQQDNLINSEISKIKNSFNETVLFTGSASTNDVIVLSESFRNFRQIMFMGYDSTVGIFPTSMIPYNINVEFGVLLTSAKVYNNKETNKLEGFGLFIAAYFKAVNDTTLNIIASDSFSVKDTFFEEKYPQIIKIVGVGRKG